MSVRGSVAIECVKLLFGKSDPVGFLISISVILVTNPLIIMELKDMDFFFIPEGTIIPMIAVMAVFGIFSSIAWAGRFKYIHAKDENWKGKYIASMFLNMIIAPLVANILLSILVQTQTAIVFNPASYLFMLVIAIIVVSALDLLVLNYGPKYVWASFKKNVVEEVVEVKKDIEQTVKNEEE